MGTSPKSAAKSPHSGRGLVVRSPGGRLGWMTRRLFPDASTRVYLAFIRATRAGPTRRAIKRFNAADATPWFDHVELETVNRCNGDCAFCPVNRRHDPRPFQRMSATLFNRIIDQLAAIDYSGYLGLFSNNEPLLDPRLADFAAAARQALPRAAINLSSNGSLLSPELFRTLLPHFDRIVLNNYNSRPVMHESIRAIRDFCDSREGRSLLDGKTVEINLRRSEDVLTSRAGNAPNRPPPAKPLSIPCSLPFSQLIVRPDGKTSLCCNDALGQTTLGDLATQSLAEAWLGTTSQKIRRLMSTTGRSSLPLCQSCDFLKHDVV